MEKQSIAVAQGTVRVQQQKCCTMKKPGKYTVLIVYNKSLFSKNEIEKIDEKLIKKGYEIFKPHILNKIKE